VTEEKRPMTTDLILMTADSNELRLIKHKLQTLVVETHVVRFLNKM